MISEIFSMEVSEGFGQLEAYIDAKEGVAFEMDNKLIWESLDISHTWAIQGAPVKKRESKFRVTLLSSGKVTLRDWSGTYIAPLPFDADPNIYPLRLVPDLSPDNESLQFDVFYRANKVAFRAYNGLFLARIPGGFNAVEAAEQVADESCCFRPMIGDLCIHPFEILKVSSSDMFAVKCYPFVVKRERITNKSNKPKFHTFCMSWDAEVKDKVAWKHLWGLGLANSFKARINGMEIILKYTVDNEKVVYVTRKIYESCTRQVEIPPKSVCTASLLVNMNHHAVCTFMAIIRKEICEGGTMTLHQPGAWTGVVYKKFHLDIKIEPVKDICNIM